MRSDRIILLNIIADRGTQLLRRRIIIYVYELGLQTSEPPLNHYIVCPSGLAVHALPYLILTKQILMDTLIKSGFRGKKAPDLWAFFLENNLKSVFP